MNYIRPYDVANVKGERQGKYTYKRGTTGWYTSMNKSFGPEAFEGTYLSVFLHVHVNRYSLDKVMVFSNKFQFPLGKELKNPADSAVHPPRRGWIFTRS